MSRVFNPSEYKGQFILTSENKGYPGFNLREFGSWKLFTSDLPVIDVYNTNKQFLGWCVGYPIVNEVLIKDELVIDMRLKDSIEGFYYMVSGRWSMFLISADVSKVFVDSCGSLSTVYSETERTIASTPTLIDSDDWNKELMNELGFPEKINWLPFGLTFKENVKRLVPNHYLDLLNWTPVRHWPTAMTDFGVEKDTKQSCKKIALNVQSTIKAISNNHKINLSLTAGRDSRMILACARNVLQKCHFFTFQPEKANHDVEIPSLLAKTFHLDHDFVPIVYAKPDELEQWLNLTGYSVSGQIWKIHKTLESFDQNSVVMPGMAGEVGRAFYWKVNDNTKSLITAKDILKRIHMPLHEKLIAKAENWLAELSYVNTFTLLDLLYIEQRLGCWSAPQYYGNTTVAFELAPLNSRTIFHTMLRLPHDYRFSQKLANELILNVWPELLELPFNRRTGILPACKARIKKTAKSIFFIYQYITKER